MIPFATVVLIDMLGAVLYFYFTLMIVCVRANLILFGSVSQMYL